MIYEKSFNEIIRICIDYEEIVLKFEGMLQQQVLADDVLVKLCSMIQILERKDFKTKLLTELYAVEKLIKQYTHEEIDEGVIEQILEQAATARHDLTIKSAVASKVMLSDMLLSKVFYKHQGVDAQLCQKSWFCQSLDARCEQLRYWLSLASGYTKAVRLLLYIYRGFGQFEENIAKSGFFQTSFLLQDLKRICMIRVKCLDPAFYPVIAMTKRWLSVTLYESSWVDQQYAFRPAQSDVAIELAVCSSNIAARDTVR